MPDDAPAGTPAPDDDAVAPAYRRLVVPVDFSDGSLAAARWAIRAIAAATDADEDRAVHLVHAVEATVLRGLSVELQSSIDDALEDFARRVMEPGVAIERTVRAGRPHEVVRELVAAWGGDLVVQGARGQTKDLRLHLGSTADRIVRSSRVPVLTLSCRGEAPGTFRHVVHGTDFSEASDHALDAVERIAPAAASVTLVHGWLPPLHYGTSGFGEVVPLDDEGLAEASVEGLEHRAARLRHAGRSVSVESRRSFPAAVIEEVAAERNADLIVLGSHGMGPVEQFLLGSVPQRVLHHVECSVLVVPTWEVAG